MAQHFNPLIGDWNVRPGAGGGSDRRRPSGPNLRQRLAAALMGLRQRALIRHLFETDAHLAIDIGFRPAAAPLLSGWPMWQMLTAAR